VTEMAAVPAVVEINTVAGIGNLPLNNEKGTIFRPFFLYNYGFIRLISIGLMEGNSSMISTEIAGFYHFYPSIAAVIGASFENKTNFMAAAWHTGVSHSPPLYLVSVAPKRHTYDMIVRSGEFTVNFLPMDKLTIIHGSGIVSGAEIDKVNKLRIPLEESIIVKCPTIESAYAAYECRVVHRYPAGDHSLFVGEVVAVHSDGSLISERGMLDPEQIDFAMYLGANTYISANPDSMRVLPEDLETLINVR